MKLFPEDLKLRTVVLCILVIFFSVFPLTTSEFQGGNGTCTANDKSYLPVKEGPCMLVQLGNKMHLGFMQTQGFEFNQSVSTQTARDFHDFLVESFRKSRSAACMPDDDYVRYVAAMEFERFRRTLFANSRTRTRWLKALEFKESDIQYPYFPNYRTIQGKYARARRTSSGQRFLDDTEVLVLWLRGVLYGVIISDCPFYTPKGELINACYVPNLTLEDRIDCFKSAYVSSEDGVECGGDTFAIEEKGSQVFLKDDIEDLENCALVEHAEIVKFNSKGAKRFQYLRTTFFACWAELASQTSRRYSAEHMRDCGRDYKHIAGRKTTRQFTPSMLPSVKTGECLRNLKPNL